MTDFEKIMAGLDLLVEKDSYLMKKDVNERSLTHKLAEYYQLLFPTWNVDCEFNRNLDKPKEIEIDPSRLLSNMARYIEEKLLPQKNIKDHLNSEELITLADQLRDERNINFELLFFTYTLGNVSSTVPIFPDIIVHHRGTLENHIVIEAKKSTNKKRGDVYYDLIKLLTLVESPEYKYKKGIFITIPTGDTWDLPKIHYSKEKVFGVVTKLNPEHRS